MSPRNGEEISDEATSNSIMGPRPPQLRINKDSHHIRKQTLARNNNSSRPPPVIIYTHPPKVIHTKPSDFMALVQKLTGLSPNSQEPEVPLKSEPPPPAEESDLTEEKAVREVKQEPAMMFDDECGGDAPLFSATSSGEFLYSLFQWPTIW